VPGPHIGPGGGAGGIPVEGGGVHGTAGGGSFEGVAPGPVSCGLPSPGGSPAAEFSPEPQSGRLPPLPEDSLIGTLPAASVPAARPADRTGPERMISSRWDAESTRRQRL
jgi:hypothetical protein